MERNQFWGGYDIDLGSGKFRWVLDKLMRKLDEKIYRRLNLTSRADIFRTYSFYCLIGADQIKCHKKSQNNRHFVLGGCVGL